jgi:hypothetical protein
MSGASSSAQELSEELSNWEFKPFFPGAAALLRFCGPAGYTRWLCKPHSR